MTLLNLHWLGFTGEASSQRDHPLPRPWLQLLSCRDSIELIHSTPTNEGPHGCEPRRR